MRKINNPYDALDGHFCFACSKKNPIGLKLEFYEDGDEIIAFWQASKEYSGFHNILHGGIQSVLMDEIAAWCVQIKQKTAGVTSKLESRYKKPVYLDQGKIQLRSKVIDVQRNLVNVRVQLLNADNELCAEGDVQYYTFPQHIAQKKLHFPDYSEFFKED